MFRGSRTNDTPRETHLCPKRRPPRSQHPVFAVFAEVVCIVGTTPPHVTASPPPNGGNGVIRTTTRRRHADSQLLVLQNPPPPSAWRVPERSEGRAAGRGTHGRRGRTTIQRAGRSSRRGRLAGRPRRGRPKRASSRPPPAKFRMQFDWVKIQQGLKTLRFQRCEFRI